MNLQNSAQTTLNVLKEIENDFSAFQKKSKLQCPSGCAKCCFSPEISCHPFEMLPLALDLCKRGIAEEVLNSLEKNHNPTCSLLVIENQELGLGYCKEYEFRPLICRAFGIAGITNKFHETELSLCSVIKEKISVENIVIEKEKVPQIKLSKAKLEMINPVFLEKTMPINQALKLVLEKVLIFYSYAEKN